MQPDIMNIFKDGVLVDVTVCYWSGAKMLTATDLGLEEKNVVDAFHLGKKLLLPARVIQNIRRIEGRARATVEENSFRFNIGNAKFVPHTVYQKVNETLRQYKADYITAVQDLLDNYEVYKAEMQPVYKEAALQAWVQAEPAESTFGPDFDPEAAKNAFVGQYVARINSYYPPVQSLPDRFSLEWTAFEIAPVQNMNDEYREQMNTKVNTFIEDAVGALRQQTIELCNEVAGNITEGKVIRSNTLDRLKTFIDKFRHMNFVGDQGIEDSLDKIQTEILDAYPPDQFHDDQELKSELKRRLVMISAQAKDLTDISSVTGEYKRRVIFTPAADAAA